MLFLRFIKVLLFLSIKWLSKFLYESEYISSLVVLMILALKFEPLFFSFISFCKKSIEDVKNFLVQYCDERKHAGFVMTRDPLSIFYEAVCVGLDREENLTAEDLPQPPPPPTTSGAFVFLFLQKFFRFHVIY